MQGLGRFGQTARSRIADILGFTPRKNVEEPAMRLLIEIIAAILLICCVSVSSAAYAAGKMGRTADGLGCGVSVSANASPAARCAAIKRQCGGKFYANACGKYLLSAVN
jgi:hypothetical protein